jgi:hypothetical protein
MGLALTVEGPPDSRRVTGKREVIPREGLPTSREQRQSFKGRQVLEFRDAYRNPIRHPWESNRV